MTLILASGNSHKLIEFRTIFASCGLDINIVSPFELKKLYPMTEETNRIVSESRGIIREIIEKKDKRLLAIVGPCSIHDEKSAIAR